MPRRVARPVGGALVTGAAGAFGSATLRALQADGLRVVGLDRAAAPDVVPVDLTDAAATGPAVQEAVDRLGGRVDLLVHVAGIGPAADAGLPPGAEVTEVLEVNFLAAWRVTAAALPALLAAPGRARCVFVASQVVGVPLPFAAAYTASKRALTAYADTLRVEYGPRLAVTTVLPGYVDTPIHDRSRRAGVSLDGLVPAERVDDVVAAVRRVAKRPRPPREVATSRPGRVARVVTRHAPGLVEVAVRRRTDHLLRNGRFDDSPLVRALLQRLED